jgi:outer membrane immunogenic protein
MKQLLLAAAGCVLCAGSATAQDATYNWSGAHVGAQIGYGWADSELDFGLTPSHIVTFDDNGFVGGAYAGYNFQFTNGVVVGIEGDAILSSISTRNVPGVTPAGPVAGYRYGSDQEWAASFRARLGYAMDRVLPFVTAGISVASYEHFQTGTAPFSESKTYGGWAIGAGLEFAATDHLIIRSEYRYSDFGSNRFHPVGWTAHEVDLTTHDLRFGIAYKF